MSKACSTKPKGLSLVFEHPPGFVPAHTIIIGLDSAGRVHVQAHGVPHPLLLHGAIECITAVVVDAVTRGILQTVAHHGPMPVSGQA